MNQNIREPFIPFARPCLGREEEEAVLKVMRSGWLTTGKEAGSFEQEFSELLGTKHAKALNSATAGLHLSLEALKIPKDSYVITTPFTFTASSEIIRYMGAHPLFVDIDERTLNIDPVKLGQLLETTDKPISAIIPVHLGGRVCPMDEIMSLAEPRGLKVIEDCAHALPSHRNGKPAGTWGDTGVFSFYATKTITTGEGGMVITNNDEAARQIEILRLHGIDRQVWGRFQSRKRAAWEYDVVAPGYKYNITDMAAAMGRVQLKRVDEFYQIRSDIAQTYLSEFQSLEGMILPEDEKGMSWHLFIIQLPTGSDREAFMTILADDGIGTSVHYKPLHLMTYYAESYSLTPNDFPRASRVYERCLSLPIYPGMTDSEIQRVVDAVKKASKSCSKMKVLHGAG